MTVLPADIALVGTTASGKSALALRLAEELADVEIVSVDSMQVYRSMDIGTAKPEVHEQVRVRHHMIDLVDANEDFDLATFVDCARRSAAEIHERGNRVLYVGGPGLYFQAVVDGFQLPGSFPGLRTSLEADENTEGLFARLAELDPAAVSRIDPGNRRRIIRALEVTLGTGKPFSTFGPGVDEFPESNVRMIGIWLPRAVNIERIEQRIDSMFDKGWMDEVRQLKHGELSRTAAQALGYKQLLSVLDGETTIEDARAEIISSTKSFARRQRMWFRRDPRIDWYATESTPDTLLAPILKDLMLEQRDRSSGHDSKEVQNR